jgi:3,4-dihydroxy 2-butanone 4-phosphate synthase / GTP cyclohydrolase II
MALASVEQAIADYREGKFVIIVDDEGRENEGDLAIAAEKVTTDAINFMATHARGLICVAMAHERLDELRIPPMVQENTARYGTAFSVSVEAARGVTTGISAADRATTIRALIDPSLGPDDFVRPGHTFPLRARPGGVLERTGQTEASVDLARLAGLYPAGVICEVMNEDGTMARMPQLEGFAERHGVNIISVAQLIDYRRRHERQIRRLPDETTIPTPFGDFRLVGYEDTITHDQHLVLLRGDPSAKGPALVRVHSECLTGDVFGSRRCDCGEQLHQAMKVIADEGAGAIVYMRGHEGRGIGLHNKIRAYRLQDLGFDTVDANTELGFPDDLRDYSVCAQILLDLGLTGIRLLTNNPAKLDALHTYGVTAVERVPIVIEPNPSNLRYLTAKQKRMGHLLNIGNRGGKA